MKYWHFLPFLLLLSGCASMGAPTGGPRDEEPPQLLESNPPHASVSFSGQRVELLFDESIQVTNAREILIAPIPKEQPNISVRRNRLIIEFPEQLLPNTTYIIQLGNAVKDVTEGNPVPYLNYVFSTGSALDSNIVAGKVVEAASGKPIVKAKVLLFENNDTTDLREVPQYFGLTDAEGVFRISYLPTKKFTALAIKDEDGNNKWSQNEMVGFHGEAIDFTVTDSYFVSIRTYKPKTDTNFVKFFRHVQKDKFIMELNAPADTISISPLAASQKKPMEFYRLTPGLDSVWVWYNNISLDSLHMRVIINNRFIDTASAQVRDFTDKPIAKLSFRLQKTPLPGESVWINTSEPIIEFQPKNILLIEDSVAVTEAMDVSQENFHQFRINYSFKSGSSYQIIIPRETTIDFYGRNNDSTSLSFAIGEKEDFGTIQIKVHKEIEQQVLVQLVDQDLKVERQEVLNDTAATFTFPFLPAKTYRFRFVVDENRNNRWDAGSVQQKRQPEQVYFLEQELEVRPNWDFMDLNYTVESE